jgi:hypothetical protein
MGKPTNHNINTGRDIPNDPELHGSFGMPVPEVHGTLGKIVNFGILAGSSATEAKPVYPKRNICFDDSVEDQRKNLPGSH